MKLNLGCGRDARPGYTNVDYAAVPGVGVVADLTRPLPFEDETADFMLLSHVIEHIANPLPMMQELHRIAKSGAVLRVRCPYGSSDDADEDPTHVRRYFLQSFAYFAQPTYWRADYGYRGDWQVRRIALMMVPGFQGLAKDQVLHHVMHSRNVVKEMVADLQAIKPNREPLRDLQVAPEIEVVT